MYIEAQLKAFKEQTRADPDAQAYMWGMAAQLSDGQITALGDYFSAQPAAPGKPGNAKRIAQGKRLFLGGGTHVGGGDYGAQTPRGLIPRQAPSPRLSIRT